MSDDLQNHFQIELVSQTEIVNSNKQLKCIASLIYTGTDPDFREYIKDKLPKIDKKTKSGLNRQEQNQRKVISL
jgi:hypothetical protein